MVQWEHPQLSIRRQCELIGLNRSTLYTVPAPASAEDLELMRRLDERYLQVPTAGSRRMTVWLRTLGYAVNRKRVQRLMRLMGLVAIYPKPRPSRGGESEVFPYLLRDLPIVRPNQVWASDITYIPMAHGFMYLAAVLDWFSRYVLAWRLSNTLETDFCLDALEAALAQGTPEIFNSDQGSQFRAHTFTARLRRADVRISMNGRGRAIDNIFVERLWRTVKYEDVYLRDYETVPELREGLSAFFTFYNHERHHQALGYKTPAQVHFGG